MSEKFNVSIDVEKEEILYSIDGKGRAKTNVIHYDDVVENPEILNMFSGQDGYMIGTIFNSARMGHVLIKKNFYTYKFLVLIAMMFSVFMVLSNILSTKLSYFFGYTVTGALFLYPITYIFDYIITDIYGYQNARRVLIVNVGCLALSVFLMYFVVHLPPSPFWPFQKEFSDVMGRTIRTFSSSTIAFMFSFFVSSYILQKLKVKNNKFSLFRRVFISLLISEMLDTGIFCFLAFHDIWPVLDMVRFMVISYFSKVTYELLVYPIITRPIINFIKRKEQLDIVDNNTNFTPFSWEVKYSDTDNIF